jgi:hypothetical protein
MNAARDSEDPTSPTLGKEKATKEGYVGQAAIPPERFDSRRNSVTPGKNDRCRRSQPSFLGNGKQ